jgi:hypothetical protein
MTFFDLPGKSFLIRKVGEPILSSQAEAAGNAMSVFRRRSRQPMRHAMRLHRRAADYVVMVLAMTMRWISLVPS